jgi:archaellum component FlaC
VQDPATYATNLSTAADNVDRVYEQLARWPALSLRGRAVAAGQAAGQYEDASKEALARFREQVEEIGEKVTGLRARVDEEVDQVQQVRSEAIQELQTNVETELTSVKHQVVGIESAVNAHLKTLENLTEETEGSLKERLADFGEWSRTEAADNIREAIDELRDDTAKSVAETKEGTGEDEAPSRRNGRA